MVATQSTNKASAAGHLNILTWLYSNIQFKRTAKWLADEIFYAAIANKQFEVLEWAHINNLIQKTQQATLEVIEWTEMHGYHCWSSCYILAADTGRLDIIRLYHQNHIVENFEYYCACEAATCFSDLHILKWLYQYYSVKQEKELIWRGDDFYAIALEKGHCHIADWLMDNNLSQRISKNDSKCVKKWT